MKPSQNETLKKWLVKNKTITPLRALNELGIYRLASRVRDLRDEGMNIETKMIYKHPVKFAQYRLLR